MDSLKLDEGGRDFDNIDDVSNPDGVEDVDPARFLLASILCGCTGKLEADCVESSIGFSDDILVSVGTPVELNDDVDDAIELGNCILFAVGVTILCCFSCCSKSNAPLPYGPRRLVRD